jgi:hypothetical protein
MIPNTGNSPLLQIEAMTKIYQMGAIQDHGPVISPDGTKVAVTCRLSV